MGAEYLSYVKSIATFAPTFYGHIISVLASVATEFAWYIYMFHTLRGLDQKKIMHLKLAFR